MNALVSYGSSSDDDDDVPTGDQAKSPVISAATAAATGSPAGPGQAPGRRADTTEDAVHAPQEDLATPSEAPQPMIGPAMPLDRGLDDNGGRGMGGLDDHVAVSERDSIRYLTQASHPITTIPASPPGSPDPAVHAKFERFLALKRKSVHFNEDLAGKSSFRNPSFLSAMMVRAGVAGDDQYNTSLPAEVWDPAGFPAAAYKEELLRAQVERRAQAAEANKARAAAGKRTIDFTAAQTYHSSSSRHSTPGGLAKAKQG